MIVCGRSRAERGVPTSDRPIDHGAYAQRGREIIPAPGTFGHYEANKPIANAFCPRFGTKGASARLSSSSRRLEGL
jgi:hypothetical protein